MECKEKIKDSLMMAVNYIEKTNYKGRDPYDIKSQRIYIYFIGKIPILKKAFELISIFFPLTLRRLFFTKKNYEYSSVFGYMVETYVNLYKITLEKKYLEKAQMFAEKLINSANTKYKGLSWGLPFDWLNGNFFFPKHTSNTVNTLEIGSAFIELYEFDKDEKYFKIISEIAEFITKGLNITIISDDKICFSYTPLDNYKIHNVNLLASDFLLKASIITNNKSYYDFSVKALNFSFSDMNEDAYLSYHAQCFGKIRKDNDSYHSLFGIRSIYSFINYTNDEKCKTIYKKYLDTITKQYLLKEYPISYKLFNFEFIETYGCAEAIYSHAILHHSDKELLEKAKKYAIWTIDHFQYSDGSFYYQMIKKGPIKFTAKIKFVRCSQAIMCRALSRLLVEIS